MLTNLKKFFRRPTPLEVATKELTETELRLLQAQTAVEWAEAQVVECQKRIKRLRSYINAETGDTK